MNPKHGVFVISKGRAKNCITAKELTLLKVPFKLVVEPVDYEEYVKYNPQMDILTLPFSNLGQGSIPARNWVWQHSKANGDERHWILDDNIQHFYRLNKNTRLHLTSGTAFKCAEDFVNRYENVALAGFNYLGFAKKTDKVPPFYLNTRIYSCILIKNDIPYEWRGRYNEDTDLSLRVLKDGWCTVLFNAFLAEKVTTMRMKGGNTDNVYTDDDNRLKFAKSLEELHPDVVKVTWKFKRWHHQVDYRPFKINKLRMKEGLVIPQRVNNYGMKLVSMPQ